MDSLAELCLFAMDFVLIQELHGACVGTAKKISLLKPEHGSVSAAGCKPQRVVSCSWGQNNFETGNNPDLRIFMNKMQF